MLHINMTPLQTETCLSLTAWTPNNSLKKKWNKNKHIKISKKWSSWVITWKFVHKNVHDQWLLKKLLHADGPVTLAILSKF